MRTTAQGQPAHSGRYGRFAVRVLALFAILAVVMAVIAVQVYRTVGAMVEANAWVSHTHEVMRQIVTVSATLRDAEAAQRAYVIGGNASRMADAYVALSRLDERLARLRDLVADNAQQLADAQQFGTVLEQRKKGVVQLIATYRESGLAGVQANTHFAAGREQDALIDAVTTRMIAYEESLLAQRKASVESTGLRTRALTLLAVLLCLGVMALALMLTLREQSRRLASERRVVASNEELARSLASSQRLGDTLNQLSDLGHLLQGCRSLDEATAGLQTALAGLFPDSAGAVNLINASQNLIAPASSWGESTTADPVFAPDDCWALRLGHAYPEEGSIATFTCKHLPGGSHDPHTRLCVPLFAQGATLGTLLLSKTAPIDRETRHAAIAAAEQVSLAIANLRLQETLRTQSLRDSLTGLFNRRYLEVSLARDLTRAIRRSQPLAVLMLDVDHFKRFNDSFGHDAGDTLLAQFGELLATLARSEDVACRYGGEEFTIVMQEADAALALDRAEDIRRQVAEMQVLHRNQNLGQVTVSIGIASYPQDGDSPEQLLRRADRALYTAKNNGRNQVCVADRS